MAISQLKQGECAPIGVVDCCFERALAQRQYWFTSSCVTSFSTADVSRHTVWLIGEHVRENGRRSVYYKCYRFLRDYKAPDWENQFVRVVSDDLNRAVLATDSSPLATHITGLKYMYINSKNLTKAAACFRDALQRGFGASAFYLGILMGLEKNDVEMLRMFLHVRDHHAVLRPFVNSFVVRFMMNHDNVHVVAELVAPDAYNALRTACLQEIIALDVGAQTVMGFMLISGVAMVRDHVQGLKCIRRALMLFESRRALGDVIVDDDSEAAACYYGNIFALLTQKCELNEPKDYGYCSLCFGNASRRCSGCLNNARCVAYCSEEHQRIDWKHHRKQCISVINRRRPQTTATPNRQQS